MISLNLINLLQQYKPAEAKKESDKGLKQQEIGKKLCNILLIGANKMNTTQQNAVKKFQAKFSKTNQDDIVIKVVNELTSNWLISEQMSNLPEDIRVAIDAHKDISTMNLSAEDQLKIAVYAEGRLCDAASEDAPLNYSDLLQFTKVIAGFGFKLLDNDTQEKVIQALNVILEKTDPKDELVSKLHDMAKTVLKKHEAEHLPPALDEQFKKCNAYHGKAINDGIIAIQNELRETGKADQMLLKFATDYCGDHLKPKQYLIRLSSRVTNDIEKNKFFVITITSRPKYKREINNCRYTCIDHSKGGPWVMGKPPKEPKEGEKLTSYETLKDLFKAMLPNYKPCTPPTPVEAANYAKDYINTNIIL